MRAIVLEGSPHLTHGLRRGGTGWVAVVSTARAAAISAADSSACAYNSQPAEAAVTVYPIVLE